MDKDALTALTPEQIRERYTEISIMWDDSSERDSELMFLEDEARRRLASVKPTYHIYFYTEGVPSKGKHPIQSRDDAMTHIEARIAQPYRVIITGKDVVYLKPPFYLRDECYIAMAQYYDPLSWWRGENP